MATSSPRNSRSSFGAIFRRSLPLNVAVPLAIRPGGCGMSPSSAIVLTLLPEPDSPTIPSVSPGKTSYEMPSTAWTMPSSVRNSTARSRIDRSGSAAIYALTLRSAPESAAHFPGAPRNISCTSGTNSPLLRVERVAQPVADEVDADHDDHEHEAGQHGQPPFLRELLAAGDELAERRRRVGDAEAEEREERLEDDRVRDGERPVHHDRAKGVREHVAEHDAHVPRADGLRSLDVLLLAQRQEDAAHNARNRRPIEGGDDRDDRPLVAGAPKQRGDGQEHDEHRQRQDEVGDAHDHVVDPAAVVAGDGADEEPEDRRHDRDHEVDLLGRLDAVDHAAEVVASDLVRPEVVMTD